jgi:hypothetical protein
MEPHLIALPLVVRGLQDGALPRLGVKAALLAEDGVAKRRQ